MALESKIPDLEKEKKAFAASRSFKEAARVTNEIKEINAKIQDIEDKVSSFVEKEKENFE